MGTQYRPLLATLAKHETSRSDAVFPSSNNTYALVWLLLLLEYIWETCIHNRCVFQRRFSLPTRKTQVVCPQPQRICSSASQRNSPRIIISSHGGDVPKSFWNNRIRGLRTILERLRVSVCNRRISFNHHFKTFFAEHSCVPEPTVEKWIYAREEISQQPIKATFLLTLVHVKMWVCCRKRERERERALYV